MSISYPPRQGQKLSACKKMTIISLHDTATMFSHCLSSCTALLSAFGKHKLLNYTTSVITRFLFYTVLRDTTLTKEQFIKQEKSHLSHLSVGAGVAIWQVAAHSPSWPASGIAQTSLPGFAESIKIHKQSERRNTRSYPRWQCFRWRAIWFSICLQLLLHDSGSS